MSIHRLLLAAGLLALAACASPTGLADTSPACTIDPDDNQMVCPNAALQR
jgi:hypothetical protein